jgi:hypothetical protein
LSRGFGRRCDPGPDIPNGEKLQKNSSCNKQSNIAGGRFKFKPQLALKLRVAHLSVKISLQDIKMKYKNVPFKT